MKVLKFGGSSVKNAERIQNVINILKSYHQRGDKFTVVFSAFGGITDMLLDMSVLASKGDEGFETLFDFYKSIHEEIIDTLFTTDAKKEVTKKINQRFEDLHDILTGIRLIKEITRRSKDYVVSFGERNAAYIIANAMNEQGIPSEYLDARRIIKTDNNYGSAKVDVNLSYQLCNELYKSSQKTQVVTGFIGSTNDDTTTTLGRGGSDYTASLIGGGLHADVIEIWTDVNGVLTTDPRKVKNAFPIPSMTYAEAMEMSHFGAKVIYPPTILPAMVKNIPLYIKNTFNPHHEGTRISDQSDRNGFPIKGISSISDITLVTLQGSGLFGVPGIAARLFSALGRNNVNIIMITQGSSEYSISFAIKPEDVPLAQQAVEDEFAYEFSLGLVDPLKIEPNLAIIAVIGENMRYSPGISGRLFQSLGKNGINAIAIAQGSSELNVSVVISKNDETKALNALHDGFFLSSATELNLFLVGVGLIGSTLLKQIKETAAFLEKERHFKIKVVGIANSQKMLIDANGIDLSNWKDEVAEKGENASLKSYIEQMKSLNLPFSIFVDNTASVEVAKHYETILDSSISISTPNKVGTSAAFESYKKLKTIADRRGVKYNYETNVGAGLPVISTLNDLMSSGDRILKIEGVLSGSLSYIFNNFTSAVKFSDVVLKAKELGYTEPDPRDDLSGSDVKRKILILAREAGYALEPQDVVVENILPKSCWAENAPSTEEFFAALVKENNLFAEKMAAASAAGKKLRFIAQLEDGKATVSLQSVDEQHPFYSLNGSDNMIVFTTERYKERPLVIRGPGAGAEVTAAGVFAEIISIGNYLT